MPLTLQNIRDGVRKSTGEDSTDLTDVDLDRYINRSFWEIQDKLPFRIKEKTVTFPTISGVALYDVPDNLENVRLVSIVDLNTNEHTQLIKMSEAVYENTYQNETYANTKPTNYVREGVSIRLWPTPDNVYTIVLKYNAILADLINATDTPPLPQIWGEIIEFGATWRRFKDLNDYVRVNANRQLQRDLLGTATDTKTKENVDNRMAGLDVVRFDNY